METNISDVQPVTFSQRFNREVKSLSKKESEVCEFLQSHANDVIHMSITELADRCATSEP